MINKANVSGRSHPSANGTPRLTKWSTNSITSPRKRSKSWKVRMKTLIEHIKSHESYAQFNLSEKKDIALQAEAVMG